MEDRRCSDVDVMRYDEAITVAGVSVGVPIGVAGVVVDLPGRSHSKTKTESSDKDNVDKRVKADTVDVIEGHDSYATENCEGDERENESATSPLLESRINMIPGVTTTEETTTTTTTKTSNDAMRLKNGRTSSNDFYEERNEENRIGFSLEKPNIEEDHFSHAKEGELAKATSSAAAAAATSIAAAAATIDVTSDLDEVDEVRVDPNNCMSGNYDVGDDANNYEGATYDLRNNLNNYKGATYDVKRRSCDSNEGVNDCVKRIDVIDPWGYVQASTPIMREEEGSRRRGGGGRGGVGRGRKFWKRCEGSARRSIFASMKNYINAVKGPGETSGSGSGGGGGGGSGCVGSFGEEAAMSSLEDWSKI